MVHRFNSLKTHQVVCYYCKAAVICLSEIRGHSEELRGGLHISSSTSFHLPFMNFVSWKQAFVFKHFKIIAIHPSAALLWVWSSSCTERIHCRCSRLLRWDEVLSYFSKCEESRAASPESFHKSMVLSEWGNQLGSVKPHKDMLINHRHLDHLMCLMFPQKAGNQPDVLYQISIKL